MLAFGLIAALPHRRAVARGTAALRTYLAAEGTRAKGAFPIVLAVISVLVLTGLDKLIKAVPVDQSQQLPIDLTTRV